MKEADTKYQIKDLYNKFEDLKTSMNSGFGRIEKKLDDFISAQAVREDGQDKEINNLKTKTASKDKFQELENTALQVENKNLKSENDELRQKLARSEERADKLQNIINTIQVAINQ